MEDDPTPGCGISTIWHTSDTDPLKAACDWHDQAYEAGSWQQWKLSRLQVDRHFLQLMLNIARGRLWLKARAIAYYITVRTLGASWWEGKR